MAEMPSAESYVDRTLAELLECFAAGVGPAAGSAVGITGALAAGLVQMVGQLTASKPTYAAFHPRCGEIQKRASELSRLLLASVDEDARLFAKVIEARRARDAAPTEAERQVHADAAIQALRPAVDLPLSICRSCLELAGLAEELLHHGLKSAQGDSRTAMGLALAAGEGALAAAEFNLRSFPPEGWAQTPHEVVLRLWAELVARQQRVPDLFPRP
jgi:formiminotetrahydrofolate cyclodeaminase